MLICLDCGKVFDDEDVCTVFDQVGELATDGKDMDVCPYCKGNYIVEAHKCENCEEYFCEEDLSDGFCDKCGEELINRFNYIWKTFSEEEKEFLQDNYDW